METQPCIIKYYCTERDDTVHVSWMARAEATGIRTRYVLLRRNTPSPSRDIWLDPLEANSTHFPTMYQ